MAMASLAETRDNETGNHIRRTQHYVRALAKKLQTQPKFTHLLTDDTIELLYKSAPLHDIGKVGIPDAILLKPGKLTAEEFEVMKTHTTLGRDAIAVAEKLIDTPNTFLGYAREIAYSHQEKWDGSGYPAKLKGEAIPLSARLMAVADVYNALISRRVYKPPFPHDEAVSIIRQCKGSHFDPDMVDAFAEVAAEFKAISEVFADTQQEVEAKRASKRSKYAMGASAFARHCDTRAGSVRARYSARAPEALTTLPHFSVSLRMNLPNSSGVVVVTSKSAAAILSR